MARFVNLVYAMLVDGLDDAGRAKLDADLAAPTDYELAVAQRYLSADAPPKAVVAPAWFDALPEAEDIWAAEARRG